MMREESGENMSSQPLPNSIRRGGLEQGFTLIELMVALGQRSGAADHLGTFFGEQFCDGLSDAATCSRDNRNFPI